MTVRKCIRLKQERQHHVEVELEGDTFSLARKYGYLPASAEDIDDILPLYQTFLAYDWKKGDSGHWEVDMDGANAKEWGRDYGGYSYRVAEKLDGRLKWGWFPTERR